MLGYQTDQGTHAPRLGATVEPGDANRAATGVEESTERRDRRRLAGAIGTEEPEELSFRDLERQAAQRLVIAVADREIVNLDHWLCGFRSVCSRVWQGSARFARGCNVAP